MKLSGIAINMVAVFAICTTGYSRQAADSIPHVLSLGDLSLSVSAKEGGRIVSLKRAGKEVLTGKTIHNRYYGAVFWISPQSVYWPPYASIDSQPYTCTVYGNSISLSSQVDELNGIAVTKKFFLSAKDTAIYIQYTVKNLSERVRKLAPWDVARVQGGLSFFPAGEKAAINRSDIPGTGEHNGISYLRFEGNTGSKGQKLFSTAKGGWLAHYYDGLLFVKCFPDIDPGEMPPGQGEVEIYVAPQGKYLELENHGRYTALQPGQSLQYNEKWFLREVGCKTESELLSMVQSLDKGIQ